MGGIPTNGSPCVDRNYSVRLARLRDGVISFMSKKLSSIPEYIQNKGNDRNNERTKKIQLFMCNHAPHPLFTFSGEKATQEVPSAVFRYPFQALRPWLSYHISSKYARYK